MTAVITACLRHCITRYQTSIPALATLAVPSGADSLASLIERYEQCYPLVEKALWSGESDFEALLACYQSLFREQDELIRQQAKLGGGTDERRHFIISIPVADRPAHLRKRRAAHRDQQHEHGNRGRQHHQHELAGQRRA